MDATGLLRRTTPLLVGFCFGSSGCRWGMMMMTGSRNLEPVAAQDGRSMASYKQDLQIFVSPLAIEDTTRKEEVWLCLFWGLARSSKILKPWIDIMQENSQIHDKEIIRRNVTICKLRTQCDELERPGYRDSYLESYFPAMRFVIWRQRLPLRTSFEFTTGAPAPTPASPVIPVTTPGSPATPVVPSVGKPFKFILESSKSIAGWFGVTCEDCPDDSIWGCYVTNSCWKVVIVALGAIFLFIALLMAIFFLGQIDDLLKYQRQLTEYEKAYPTLAKIMITPLKLFHKSFTKSYDNTMKSLTRKFGKKPWFKFLVVFPCKCLRGTWVMFQKCLQPTCLFAFTASAKTKKCIADTGYCQWAKDNVLKKAGLRADPEGDKKREIKAKREAREAAKQAKIDAKQLNIDEKEAKKQTKMDERQARKEAKEAAKQARLEDKAARKQAKLDEKEAKKEARRAAREARNDAKLDALEDAEEARQDALEAAEEAKQEAKEAAEEAGREAEEKAAEDKASKAPPTSPAAPSPPPGPPPSPAPPVAMAPPMANQKGMYGIPAQQYVDPYAAQRYMDPYAPQQYADPYEAQQYAADDYGGYGVPVGRAGAQGQATYGFSGQSEQYGMYSNDPMYGQQQQGANVQQGAYGQDQYGAAAPGQQAAVYDYDPITAAQQYPQQQYGGQQYYGQ